MKNLIKKRCVIEKCSNTFKTLPNDKTKACSNYCREEYSRTNGRREYRKTFRSIDRRLEKYKGLNGKIYRDPENLEFDY